MLLPFLALTVLLTGAGDVKAAERPRGREGDVLPSPHTALASAAGVTALTGQVKTTEGQPLANVALRDSGIGTRTNDQGEFLLEKLPAGETVLTIDGRHAGRDGKTDYGLFEVRVSTEAGKTTELPYVSYLPKIDHAHDVTITSPTTSEVVVKAAAVPGLELHIPPGAIITDTDGKPVTKIGITPIPLDRTPFPLPHNVEVPLYFTAQPGGATITGVDGNWLGVQVYYPNYRHDLPKARGTFYKYEPFQYGWTPYGQGQVTADGNQMVPDQGTRLYDLTGAMYIGNPPPPPSGPGNCNPPPAPGSGGGGDTGGGGAASVSGGSRADPVDLASGVWVEAFNDLNAPDIIPVNPQRTYNSADFNDRSFGVGMTFAYDMYLYSVQEYQTATLSLPSCQQVHFSRIQNGSNGFADAVFVNTVSEVPQFYQSRMVYNSDGWNLTLGDGTVYVFGDVAPLQAIRDRYGNTVTISHSNGQTGQVTQVTSPNGRFIKFTYQSGWITQAQDNAGRTVSYTYDSSGRMQTYTDADGGITTYSWDSGNHIAAVTDPRGVVVLTNLYDANNRVTTQTLPNGGIYTFSYIGNNGGGGFNTETDITDPRGNIETVTFNSAGTALTDNRAVGTPDEQDLTTVVDPVTNLVLSRTDALGRVTAYEHDVNGNVTKITKLAGTSNAAITQYDYGPFSRVTSVTNPLGFVTSYELDTFGVRLSKTDPLGNQTIYGYATKPYLALILDPLGNKTTFSYSAGLLSAITDALGRTSTRYRDALGRVSRTVDPLGNVRSQTFDPLYGAHQVTAPAGDVTTFNYQLGGFPGSVVDARSGTVSYTYDTANRLAARVDPLGAADKYSAYDANNNLTARTDRNGQVTQISYDSLNRATSEAYADGSVVNYVWDKGNRLIQIQDSGAGTITRTYDGLDDVLSETTPEGTVTYTYDQARRRTSMSVPGQAEVIYVYDAANRLVEILQGSEQVLIGYDADNRRTSLTLPNGIVATYSYDAASELTAISYAQGGALLGTLTYSYDLAGHRTARGGTLFQSVLPAVVSAGVYNTANRLTSWSTPSGQTTLTYDADGNLLSDGQGSYIWDSRSRLINHAASGSSFVYDALGRRQSVTNGENTVSYLYDGNDIVQEQSGGSVLLNILTGLGIDERFLRTAADGTFIYLVDGLGSTVALSDTVTTIRTAYGYEPFGQTSSSGTANDNEFQYAGRQIDASGLYYYRARYYNAAWGRFISEDPLGIKFGPNTYSYVYDNPLGMRDPLGLCANSNDCQRCLLTGKTKCLSDEANQQIELDKQLTTFSQLCTSLIWTRGIQGYYDCKDAIKKYAEDQERAIEQKYDSCWENVQNGCAAQCDSSSPAS